MAVDISAVRRSLAWVSLAVGISGLAGCAGADARKIGEFCLDESDCESGLCYDAQCLDPDGDYDRDGIRNGIEKNVTGTDYGLADTDGDGVDDGVEVGSEPAAAADGDGDGLIDALESMLATADPDDDCIPDQYDAENSVYNDDMAAVVRANCNVAGVCGEHQGDITAYCHEGVPTCDYSGVEGYESAETQCDGADNDCDGETDEGLSGPDCPSSRCVPDCLAGYHCDGGSCVADACIPDCSITECGPDPVCGTSCGACDDGFHCDAGACAVDPCIPDCEGLVCGPDRVCGVECGQCTGSDVCMDGVCGWKAGEYVVDCGADGSCRVPAGTFWMGCNPSLNLDGNCMEDASPYHQVTLAEYYIDKTEVTVESFAACVDAGVCSAPGTFDPDCNWKVSGRGNYPANCISWQQADTYCTWMGKSLPTEAQWEKAARGTDGRQYPWGNVLPSCSYAVADEGTGEGCGTGGTFQVCSRSSKGDSPYGLCDMAGNVWEWVSDWYDPGYYTFSEPVDPVGPDTGTIRVAHGGSYGADSLLTLGTSVRIVPSSFETQNKYGGFRCVAKAEQ